MTLSRIVLFSVSLAALSGVSQAQVAGGTVGSGTYQVDGSSATVGQTITLGIPKRFGLHLHRNTWTLDLTNLKSDGTVDGDGGDANCWRAGDHSSALGSAGTGRDTLFGYSVNTTSLYTVPVGDTQAAKDAAIKGLMWAAIYRGDQAQDTTNPYSYKGSLRWGVYNIPDNRIQNGTAKRPIGGYPGFYVNPTTNKLEWKGPILCTFQTIVQKFSNSSVGWQFSGSVVANTGSSFPFTLYVADRGNDTINIDGGDTYFIWDGGTANAGAAPLRDGQGAVRLARGYNATKPVTTGGWLDDNLLEAIVFDGSVAAGTYGGTVTFALTDYAPPLDINGL